MILHHSHRDHHRSPHKFLHLEVIHDLLLVYGERLLLADDDHFEKNAEKFSQFAHLALPPFQILLDEDGNSVD